MEDLQVVNKDLLDCPRKVINQVKDEPLILSCVSKSKRRRTRRKNKLIPSNEQESFCEKQSIDLELNRLGITSLENCTNPSIIFPAQCSNMESGEANIEGRNRNDVIAQRQEKRQAKLAAKLKNKKENQMKKNLQETVGKDTTDDICKSIIDEKISLKVPETKSTDTLASGEESSYGSKNVKIQDVNKSVDGSSNQLTKIDSIQKTIENEGTKGKSREEVIAEREIGKQAKLNAKTKAKPPKATDKSENILDSSTNKKSGTKVSDNALKNDADMSSAPEKSKAELRAERRAKQEAQRAAKEAEKLSKQEVTVASSPKKIEIVTDVKLQKEKILLPVKIGHPRVKLFGHLKFEQKHLEAKLMPNIHPEILHLGIKYSSRIVMGSNARCVALLKALKEVIMDYITPLEKEFSRGLESQLSNVMAYLNKCRPLSVSMINAIRHIKSHLTQLPNDVTDVEARRKLCDVIDTYIREQIDVAGEAICNAVQKKITNGDNILIYACSSLLYRILVESHKSGKQFTVVVVDSGPWFEGREMLRRLVEHGIRCSYVLVSALSFIMREVSKVFLGAHALLANGSVMSRAGSALVALVANSYNVPVLVCCETYKFCERVQLDAFVYNELGNDEDMAYTRSENNKTNESTVSSLSVLYDITPADLVTAVVTELAILPCTSVPVILRIRPSDVVS